MAFQYHGKVEKLAREVDLFKDRINQAYKDILGNKRYARLEKIANQVLVPQSYFEAPEDIKKYTGEEIPPGFRAGPTYFVRNKFNLSRFRKKLKSIVVAPSFYLSEESLRESHYHASDSTYPYLPTYVHEFNHFVFSVLQSHPLASVDLSYEEEQEVRNPKDFKRFVENLGTKKIKGKEKMQRIHGVLAADRLHKFSEDGTRILDSLIADYLRGRLVLRWRNKPIQYCTINVLGIPEPFNLPITEGDMFEGVSNLKAVEQLINWQDHFHLYFDNPRILKRIQELKKIPAEFVAITAI